MSADAIQRSGARLAVWLAFVLLLAAGNYAARAAAGKPDRDTLYQWASVAGGLIQFGFMLAIALLIAIGASKRELFALRRPRSLPVAFGLGALFLIAIYALSALVGIFVDPGEEQGLLPDKWRPDRIGPYAANFVVIAGFVPIVEELLFRGLGFSLLRRYGRWVAIVVVGLTFGAAHGLVFAFPLFAAFGIGLAYIREVTDSVYPGIVLHAIFNGVAMLAIALMG